MAHPPRIPVWLSQDQPVIYFLTMCVSERQPVLDNRLAWAAIKNAISRLDQWQTMAALAMPDHVHLLVAPLDRLSTPGEYSRWFKRWVREQLRADWVWQDGVFDRLLRNDESAQEKWGYTRDNPVTAGLITRWQDWPYQTGFQDL